MPIPTTVTLVDHPLIQHKLSTMRDQTTSTADFRRLCREIGMLMAYEALRDLPLTTKPIQTPVTAMEAPFLADPSVVLAPVLRAGLALCDGFLDILPSAQVAHVGLSRNPTTLAAAEYYFNAPRDLDQRHVVILDPMLATGNSATAAANRLKEDGARNLCLVCLLSAPEGLQSFHAAHPDTRIFTAAVDQQRNDHGYIVPGLGDAGDRIFGTT